LTILQPVQHFKLLEEKPSKNSINNHYMSELYYPLQVTNKNLMKNIILGPALKI